MNGSQMIRNVFLRSISTVALRLSIYMDFIFGEYGKDYGLEARHRAWLTARFQRSVRSIPAGTTALDYVILAREILSIPPQVQGSVVECGAWKGASTASLSLVCHLTRRRLLVCDSFEGLPVQGMHLYQAPHSKTYGYLKGGMFSGSLPEVKTNVGKHGRIEVCQFVPGLFAQSLTALQFPVVFAFLDVDLPSSFRDCLKAIWPLLVPNGAVYVDDIGCMDVAQVFFDEAWWQDNLGCPAPGVVGSGCGIPISPSHSNIGYLRKPLPFQPEDWHKDPDLYYPANPEEAQ